MTPTVFIIRNVEFWVIQIIYIKPITYVMRPTKSLIAISGIVSKEVPLHPKELLCPVDSYSAPIDYSNWQEFLYVHYRFHLGPGSKPPPGCIVEISLFSPTQPGDNIRRWSFSLISEISTILRTLPFTFLMSTLMCSIPGKLRQSSRYLKRGSCFLIAICFKPTPTPQKGSGTFSRVTPSPPYSWPTRPVPHCLTTSHSHNISIETRGARALR